MQYIVNEPVYYKGKVFMPGSKVSLPVADGKVLNSYLTPVKVSDLNKSTATEASMPSSDDSDKSNKIVTSDKKEK